MEVANEKIGPGVLSLTIKLDYEQQTGREAFRRLAGA
jgi:hypothetical protein